MVRGLADPPAPADLAAAFHAQIDRPKTADFETARRDAGQRQQLPLLGQVRGGQNRREFLVW